MVIGAIFAGGVGRRMGSADMPKQYLKLGTKPIIVHTIEKFAVNPDIDSIVVLCPKAWIAHTKDLIKKYLGEKTPKDIYVVEGGSTRNGTLENALRFISENFDIDDDSVIVTHDAVRPFLTHRIICENIEAARKYGACDTVIPATDTIVHSADSENVSDIPTRSELYQGQTPQSFRIRELESVLASLTDEEKNTLTDACKIYTIKNKPVRMVDGEVFNVKITYAYDLKVANALLGVVDDDK